MSKPPSRSSALLRFVLIFAVVYVATQFVFRTFFPEQFNPTNVHPGVVVSMEDSTIRNGHYPVVVVKNNTDETITFINRCPQPVVDIQVMHGETKTDIMSDETAVPCEEVEPLEAKSTARLSLAPWQYSLFSTNGTYNVSLALEGRSEPLSAQFTVYEPGTMTKLFRTFISKPLLNSLIFIASWAPGNNLGIAIIILTVIVKLILFMPTQHALEGQRKMQAVQPKMQALREKYKNDPQKLNQETMKLWKNEKVNPMQSCLPMLLQFPVLIGLFFVIRDSSVLELSQHLLYGPYQSLDWTWGTNFLGLDLLIPSIIIMPPFLVIMQFIQMKLSFAIADKKKAKKDDVVDQKGKKDKSKDPTATVQETQQKVMMYGLPLMIGFFAFQFPAAVSLYWGVSTVFAIGQQLVVNRKVLV